MEEPKKNYTIEFDFNEIHLILHALDEFLVNNSNNYPEKTLATAYEKLEKIHWQHTKARRDKLLNRQE